MTVTWTATPQQVEEVLAPVLPHAAGDRHLPMIRCLNLEVADGRFLAVATNRYTMGIAWASLADWAEEVTESAPFSARVYADDLQRLLGFLRPHRTTRASWTLTSDFLSVTSDSGEHLTIRTVDVEFPTWRKLLAQRATKESGVLPTYGMAPKMLDLFGKSAKAIGGQTSMAWHFGGPLDSALVTIGDSFLGLLMPVRLDDHPALDLTVLGVDVPKAVAAA